MIKRALAILSIFCIAVPHAAAQDGAATQSGGDGAVAFGQRVPSPAAAARRPVAGHADQLAAVHRHAGRPLPADDRAPGDRSVQPDGAGRRRPGGPVRRHRGHHRTGVLGDARRHPGVPAQDPADYIEFELVSPARFEVFVGGAVRSPGTMIAHAINRVQDAIRLADGVDEHGSVRRIELIRADGSSAPHRPGPLLRGRRRRLQPPAAAERPRVRAGGGNHGHHRRRRPLPRNVRAAAHRGRHRAGRLGRRGCFRTPIPTTSRSPVTTSPGRSPAGPSRSTSPTASRSATRTRSSSVPPPGTATRWCSPAPSTANRRTAPRRSRSRRPRWRRPSRTRPACPCARPWPPSAGRPRTPPRARASSSRADADRVSFDAAAIWDAPGPTCRCAPTTGWWCRSTG